MAGPTAQRARHALRVVGRGRIGRPDAVRAWTRWRERRSVVPPRL